MRMRNRKRHRLQVVIVVALKGAHVSPSSVHRWHTDFEQSWRDVAGDRV